MSSYSDIESFKSLRAPGFARVWIQRRFKTIALASLVAIIIFLGLSWRAVKDPSFKSTWFSGSTTHEKPDFIWGPYGEPLDQFHSGRIQDLNMDNDRDRRIQTALDMIKLAPDTPSPDDLPNPEKYFSDVRVDNLPPPDYKPFSMEGYSLLYHTPEQEPPVPAKPVVPPLGQDSFIKQWKSPEWFHPDGRGRKEMPRVQHDFTTSTETDEQRRLRHARRDAVKRAFVYAWQKYKDRAWGHDEVKPVAGTKSNPFQNWGATIIDSLETLLIMGLQDEYNTCRQHVNRVDFRQINGRDWAYGYRPSPETLADADAPEWKKKPHEAGRESKAQLATFEMGIRYLGGLVGAYDLSGDKLMLERAMELGKILGRGFETPSGLVIPRFDAGSKQDYLIPGPVSLAEVGSMTLELTRLSQVSGDRWYFDRAQRAIDYLETHVIPRATRSPLVPSFFHSQLDAHPEILVDGEYTLGAMADSYYEYLIKQHQLLGGVTDQYSNLYASSMDKAAKELFMDIDVVQDKPLFTIGKISRNGKQLLLEHLTCFAGAMLGLGARLLGRPQDMSYGQRLTQTCYWAGAATPTGLQPETITWWPTDQKWAWENATVSLGTYNEKGQEEVLRKEILRGHPPGAQGGNRVYLGRPETAESVFYMYRLTGDKKWQEKGWRMFTSWMDSATTSFGFSAVRDVARKPATMHDNMVG